MAGAVRLPKAEWVMAMLLAVALVYGFAPWPAPQVTEQLLRHFYPQCFEPFIRRCSLPVREFRLAAYAGLLVVTYGAVLAAYFATARLLGQRSSSVTSSSP